MEKVFLLGEKNPDHRDIRIEREFEKKKMNVVTINTFNLLATSSEYYHKGKLIDFKKNNMLWATSNSVVVQKIIACLESEVGFVWPTKKSQIFSDKFLGNCFFRRIGVKTPVTILLNNHELDKSIKAVGGLPCVIKRANGSKGAEVAIVKTKSDVDDFMKGIYEKKFNSFSHWKGDFIFILQEFIAESAGTDFRVLCLKEKIIGGIKRTSRSDDFRANVSLGGRAEKFDVPSDLAKICKKIMKKGKLFYAGIDFIKSRRGWLAIEVNTCAQFLGFEKATGINVAGKIVDALIKKGNKT